jgi:hypothetical protein
MDRLKACSVFFAISSHKMENILHAANRVSEIQDITSNIFWHPVASEDNTTDILSGGIGPEELWSSSQWCNGTS